MLNPWKSHIFRCPPGPPSPKTLQKPLRIQARGPLWLQHLHLRAREERLDTTLQRRNVGVVFEVPRPGLIVVLPRCRWRHWGDPLDHKKVQKKRKWHWKIWKSAWFWSRLSCKTESKGCVYILKCCRHVDVSKWDAQSVYTSSMSNSPLTYSTTLSPFNFSKITSDQNIAIKPHSLPKEETGSIHWKYMISANTCKRVPTRTMDLNYDMVSHNGSPTFPSSGPDLAAKRYAAE